MRTARRRWTKELQSEVDGIAVGGPGTVLVHGYDPPAGGKWVDDVIPGKLSALEPESGDLLWSSPCEVGYGRGFGAGVGSQEDVLVLGPSLHGHRAVRMSLKSGELLDAREIEAFDEAVVAEDLCHTVTATRITALSSSNLHDAWTYSKPGERYHMIVRDGERLFAVVTRKRTSKQGILVLDSTTGEVRGDLLEPHQTRIHAVAAGSGSVTALVSEPMQAVTADALRDWLVANPDADPDPSGKLGIVCFATSATAGDAPRWFDVLETLDDEFPDVLLSHDAGRLYLVQGASLEVRDLATGARAGELTVPGLDEHVSWQVHQGAGVLAEETRISVYEIPD